VALTSAGLHASPFAEAQRPVCVEVLYALTFVLCSAPRRVLCASWTRVIGQTESRIRVDSFTAMRTGTLCGR
jgi:hypothetical protein